VRRPGERLAAIVILFALLLQTIAPLLPTAAPASSAQAGQAQAPAQPFVQAANPAPAIEAVPGLDGAAPGVWTPVRPAPAYPLPAELAGKPEVTALRSAHGAVFDLGGGRYAQLQDLQPLHYQDAAGAWQVIDPAFTAVVKGWVNTTNSLRTAVAKHASHAQIGATGVGVAWQPLRLEITDPAGAAQPVADLLPASEAQPGAISGDGRTVRYSGSWSNAVADQWQTGRGQAEYSLRLPARPLVDAANFAVGAASLDLSVRLHLNAGVRVLVDGKPARLPLETSGVIEFAGADGAVLQLLPPYAFEQDDLQEGAPGSYVLTAATDSARGGAPNAVDLRVRLPWQWLAAEDRQYPVIIDPRFQMRSTTQAATARYNPLTLEFVDILLGAPANALGRSQDYANRLLVRFDLPLLPSVVPNATVSKAWLLAAPSSVDKNAKYGMGGGHVSAHLITNPLNQEWWAATSIAPSFDANPLPPGAQLMGLLNSSSAHPVTRWDVTNQVNGWLPQPSGQEFNMGLLLRTDNEQCPIGIVLDPLCAAMYFSETASNWTLTDLRETQYTSTPDTPYTPASQSSGLRLLVFFNAPTLTLNQVITQRPISQQALPPGVDPYWSLDHIYRLPAINPNRWRAVIARGFGETVATPLSQYPGQTLRRTPLQGGAPMTVRTDSNDNGAAFVDWRVTTPYKGQQSYALINGRGDPGSLNPPGFQLHVGATTDAPQPVGYDVRLIEEESTLTTSLPTPGDPNAHKRTIRVAFDSGRPLALWNLNLPAGSNTAISIVVDKDGTVPKSFMSAANNFSAQVIHSNSRFSFPDALGEGANNRWPLERMGMPPVVIGVDDRPRQFSLDFQPQSGPAALVLAYNGPQLDTFEVPDICLDELCTRPPAQELRVTFEMTIKIVSCPAGSYPDTNDNCREVRCPANNMPAAYIQNSGGLRLWSTAGWNPPNADAATSNNFGSAPLIGTAAGGPKVAIIGDVSYNRPAGTVMTSANSKAILINCPAPAANPTLPTAFFVAGQGAMARQLAGSTPVLRFSNVANIRPIPWEQPDRPDLLNGDYYIDPGAGKAVGAADLRRRTGEAPEERLLNFAVDWSWTAQGWPSFTGAAAALPNNPAPPTIASLALNLGSSFTLDTEPQTGDGYRSFTALRGPQATITQPVELGGASRPIQALILPRNAYVPSDPAISCTGSCIDLRSLDDTVNKPNRVWEMPDVRVVAAAGTVMLSAPGMLQVNSIDHPNINPANAADFAQEFSFDAYKASVSVQQEWCTQEDQQQGRPKVLVVRGETRMALPNIGDSGGSPQGAISASFKLCSSSLRSVHMEFYSPVGIPIGSSGLFLTGLQGRVDIYPERTRITMGLDFQAAPGGNGGVFKAHGEVTIDTLGLFAFQGSAKILGTVDANGKVWVAWNPLDTGFEVSASVGDWVAGSLRAHMWEGQGWNHMYSWLPDDSAKHFAGEFSATITIHEGDVATVLGFPIPPADISFGVELAFGEFCTNSGCTSYEWGIKGTFEVVGYDVGLYYGFDSGLDFILGNDDYLLIDEYGGGQTAPILQASDAQMLGPDDLPVTVQAGPAKVDGVAEIPFLVSERAEQVLLGLRWQAGAPQFSLIDPQGTVIDLANLAQFGGQAVTEPDYVLLSLQAPKPGAWKARINNLTPEGYEHYKFLYFANKGAPGAPGAAGFLLPAAPNEAGTDGYTITWQVPADVSDEATISLFYRSSVTYTGTIGVDVPIVQNLPYKSGSYAWNTSGLPSASYQIKAVVDDGVNDLPLGKISLPDDACVALNSGRPYARAFAKNRFPGTLVFFSAGSVQVADSTPPGTPTGLQVTSAGGALLSRWDAAAPTSDVTRYLVRWGAANGSTFTPEAQRIVTRGDEMSLRIGAVKTGQAYGVDVTALDAGGNAGSPSAPVFATPDAANDPVPLAPLGFQRTGTTSDSASFAWTQAGGAVPAFYRLVYTKLDMLATAAQVDVTTTAATIGALETGATYDVRLYAASAGGWLSAAANPTIRVVVSNGVDMGGDGMPEDWAAANGVSDGQADEDGDGLINAAEYLLGTEPLKQDSDGDGFSDGEEQYNGSDPLDGGSLGGVYMQPRLHLADKQLHFLAKQQPGGEPAPQSVTWANVGGGALALQASSQQGWITPGVSGDQVQVAVNMAGLAPGFYSGVVRLTAASGGPALLGDSACIRVNAWVQPADNDVTAKQSQTIDFAPLPQRMLGDGPFAVAATASSGLPVSIGSLTPEVCSVAGATVTPLAADQCSLIATQPGDGTYYAAPSVVQAFLVYESELEMPFKVFAPIVYKQ
jgi:hypothetical protein